eukprot:GHRQ01022243.1.p1 GENE.GHRQ01022243.1~~GHRQ01022243.1.p1  ORF type:complete len:123 (-),score=18.23 GHRQ01022243.1:323-691(-)
MTLTRHCNCTTARALHRATSHCKQYCKHSISLCDARRMLAAGHTSVILNEPGSVCAGRPSVLTTAHAVADAVHQPFDSLIVQVAELRARHARLLPVRVAVQRKLPQRQHANHLTAGTQEHGQ